MQMSACTQMKNPDSCRDFNNLFVVAGFEEEGLLLEDTVHRPAEENLPPVELPAELPAPEAAEVVTLPEPPVEVEASGLGQPEDPAQPTAAAEAEEVPTERASSEDGPTHPELNSGSVLEVVKEEAEEAEVQEESAAATPQEEQPNEEEIPEEPETSTAEEEDQEEGEEEEGLPAEVPPPDVVNVAREASETEQHLLEDNSAEANHEDSSHEDSNPVDVQPVEVTAEPPAEEPHSDVEALPEPPMSEEASVEDMTEVMGREVKEEAVSEAPPVVEEEVSEAPQISTEDLTEDEILLVNQELPEPPATEYLSPAPPTALSPEKESPFTRVSDVNPATEGQPRIVITPLVEVTHTLGVRLVKC